MSQNPTNRDTIIDEIHRTRQRMAEKLGGDIAAILEDARKRQADSGRTVWPGPSSNKQSPVTTDGRGDYTVEREQLFQGETVESIVAAIKAQRTAEQ